MTDTVDSRGSDSEELDLVKMRIELQNKEFEALESLITQKSILNLVAVVSDEYPKLRRAYESALTKFIEALRENGRI